MILSRDSNNLGCINRDLFKIPPINSLAEFLTIIDKRLDLDHKNGLKVSCFNFPINITFPDVSIVEEDDEYSELLNNITQRIRKGNRIVFYLPAFYFLGSQLPESLGTTKTTLTLMGGFLEAIGVEEPSIIIRIGSAYGARKKTMSRFCDEVELLPKFIQKLLIVCNDDKPSLFSVTDLMSGIYYRTNIPICFRFLAHGFNSGGLSIREALFLSCSTWFDSNPLFIHSESDDIDEGGKILSTKTTDYLTRRIPTFGLKMDVLLDSPVEEKACIKYRSEAMSLKPIVINKKLKK